MRYQAFSEKKDYTRVCGDGDPKLIGKSDQGFLREVRVKFDLQDLRFNASVAEDIQDEGTLAVTRAG